MASHTVHFVYFIIHLSILENFQGFLQTDGYAGYNALGQKNGIIHVGCLVRIRRKFVDVIKTAGKKTNGLATTILNQISKIYKIEKNLRLENFSADDFIVNAINFCA